MANFRSIVLLMLLPFCCVNAWSTGAFSIAGVWRGASICTRDASAACRNESVVYSISEIAGRTGVVAIRADKIVNGKAITMGTGEWQYDAAHHTLEWRTGQQVWLLTITGNRMDGTLTSGASVLRKMNLRKD